MHDIFCMTDVHGQYELFKTMRDWCYQQDEECCIVFLGDAADRGPDGYKIIKELLNDSHILYLYGNHEDLFIKAADAIIGRYAQTDETYALLHSCNEIQAEEIIKKTCFNEDVNLHLFNGGFSTLKSWLLDNANEEIIDKIRSLPRTFSYENIDFCHAGSTYKNFKVIQEEEYHNKPLSYIEEESLIWDRDFIPIGWESGRICVHGHTPTIYLPGNIYGHDRSKATIHPCMWQDRMGAKNKRGGWKIDMDTGATFTGRAYILNALTFEITGFFDPSVIGDVGDIEKIEQYKLNI